MLSDGIPRSLEDILSQHTQRLNRLERKPVSIPDAIPTVSTYAQASAPTGSLVLGDLWIDTDDENKIYRWNGTSWILLRDTGYTRIEIDTAANALVSRFDAFATTDNFATAWYQASAPTTTDVGDLWVDSDDLKLYRWSGTTWADQNDTTVGTALAASGMVPALGDSRVRAYYQFGAPVPEGVGDLWVDTDAGNKIYRWTGTAWQSVEPSSTWTAVEVAVEARDAAMSAQADADIALIAAQDAQTTADGKAVAYFQTTAPTGLVAGDVGDLWFDTDDGNKMYRWTGSAWVLSQDQGIADAITAADNAQSTADGKIVTFYQTSAPTASAVGDLWVDTDDANHLYRWSGSGWVSVRDGTISSASSAAATALAAAVAAQSAADAAQATADGSIRTYYQSTAPTGLNNTTDVGDLWFDTDDGQAYRWNGTTFVIIEDNSIAAALAAAQNAQTTADGKITSYYQISAPTVAELGDLWFDTNDMNKPYYCSAVGPVVWTSVRDGTIAVAQSTADAALDAATSDGIAPSTSPAPTMLSGIGAMIGRITPITNADTVTYDWHVSTTTGFTAGPTTLVGSTQTSQFTIGALPGPDPFPGDPDTRTLQYDVAYYVRVIARDADGSAAQSAQAVGYVFRVTGINLAVDSVTAANIVAGTFTGAEFAGEVFIGGTFKTGVAGQRVEWGIAGITGFRSNGSLMVKIPTTDGEEMFLDGEFVARGLTVTGGASFQSTANEVTKNASITLQRGIVSPTSTPQFAVTYDTFRPDTSTLTAVQKTNNDPDFGLGAPFDVSASAVTCIEYHPSGNFFILHHTRANGTRQWYFNPDGTPKDRFGTGTYYSDLKDWEVWGSVNMTTSSTPSKNGTYAIFRFMAGVGTDWYVSAPAGISKYTRPAGAIGTPALTSNGQDVAIVEVIGSTLNIGYRTFPSSGNVPAATTTYTTPAGAYAASLCSVLFDSNAPGGGGFDVTTGVSHRYATAERGVSYSARMLYDDGGAQPSLYPGGSAGWSSTSVFAESFESPTSNRRGMAWDGANFWTLGGDGFMYKHTSERWDSGNPANGNSVWWGRQSFYDSDATGGTHETIPGAFKSFAMKRRAKVTYTPPDLSIIDAGGTDDPDKVRLYMGKGTSQPSNANMHLQLEVSTTTDFTTLATATAIPPTTNNFPGATPAKIRNDDDSMVISGDGSIKLGGNDVAVTGPYLYAHINADTATLGVGVPAGSTWNNLTTWTVDSSSGITNSSGLFAVGRAGRYRISCVLSFTGTTGNRGVTFVISGTSKANLYTGSIAGVPFHGGVLLDKVYSMTAGQTIRIQAATTVACAVRGDSVPLYSTLDIEWIGF